MSMNAKPKDAIERMKAWLESQDFYELCQNYRHARDIKPHREGADTAAGAFERIKREIAGYLPDGAVCVVWPADLTRERLNELASAIDTSQPNAWECWPGQANALRALATIAPVRKKRVVNLWESKHSKPIAFPVGEAPEVGTWRCVARNVELED